MPITQFLGNSKFDSSAIYLGVFSRAEQRVLQAIFKAIAEGGGRCVATLTMLARDSNTSKSTTRNAIAHAVQIGLLERTERRSEFSISLPNIQLELATGRLHVRRAKNGSPSVHPMQGDEIRALRRLQREQGLSSHVFMTERDGPMTPKAFHALFGRIGARAKMPFPIHPHMLRHGCGYALANAGHDTRAPQAWLGHKNIQHTVGYTELAPHKFKNFWR
jgi:type 1 fimbriae regulatory protein FimB/type 1 fimbriae regulatory protein FimE